MTQSYSETQVIVYTMKNCPYCLSAKKLLEQRGISYKEILVPLDDDAQWDALYLKSGMRTMPQIFHKDRLIGGYQDLALQDQKDALQSLR